MAEEYILAQPETITLRAEDADRLLALGSGDAALLYLWLLRNGGRFDPARAARELKTAGGLPAAMALLRSAGLIRGEAAPAVPAAAPIREERQEYTAAEIAAFAETDPEWQGVLDRAAECLGRALSGGDMKILYNIYHDVGLPSEVIHELLQFCCEEIALRYGPGRKPTMKQVEKEAYIWGNRELFSLELADRYLLERQKRRGQLGELCELLGIRGRALAPTEEKYLLGWLEMGFGKDAILLAYDRTVTKKGGLAWPYMNRILENWHAKGLHTPAAIQAGDAPPGQKGRDKGGNSGSRRADGPTEEEYLRMQKYLQKLDGGGNHGT